MGFIRGALIVILSVLLFLVFLTGNTFFTLTSSLSYENVQSELNPLIQEQIQGKIDMQNINEELDRIEVYCEDFQEEYVFSEQGFTFSVPCDSLSQGADAIIESGVDNMVESIYYNEYNCDFWDCFGEEEIPFFLISEKAHDYWKSKFYLALGTAVILMAILFVLARKKHNAFVLPGILLIAASLPFMKFSAFFSLFTNSVIAEFLNIFFSKSYSVFIKSIIAGFVLLIIGFVFKLFVIGFKVSNFFQKKDSKENLNKNTDLVKKEKKIKKK